MQQFDREMPYEESENLSNQDVKEEDDYDEEDDEAFVKIEGPNPGERKWQHGNIVIYSKDLPDEDSEEVHNE